MLNSDISVAGVPLAHPIYNAASPIAETKKDIYSLMYDPCNDWTAAVLTKTVTLKPRTGNYGTIYAQVSDNDVPLYSLNSIGLRNKGLPYYNRLADKAALNNGTQKPLFLSLEGASALSHPEISPVFSLLELNVSCPNTGTSAPADRLPDLYEFLRQYFEGEAHTACPIGLKIPFMGNPHRTRELCDIVWQFPQIRFLTAINSVSGGLDFDVCEGAGGREEAQGGTGMALSLTPKIQVQGDRHFGGVSGRAILPLALGTVAVLVEELAPKLDIVGCGGVYSDYDVYKFLHVGASAVQMYTGLTHSEKLPVTHQPQPASAFSAP